MMVITGASGQVGGELAKLFPQAAAPGRAEMDLADPASIRAYLRSTKPEWILNPAAYTAVDKAESEPELARAVNTDAVAVLGEEACRLGAVVVHFSTDYVFPGLGQKPYTEEDPTGPLGVYGASKLAGEAALAASGAAHLILRTSWVYGATGKNFLLTVLRVARERAEMRIVDDQHGAPTTAADLARLTANLVAWAGADGCSASGPRERRLPCCSRGRDHLVRLCAGGVAPALPGRAAGTLRETRTHSYRRVPDAGAQACQ